MTIKFESSFFNSEKNRKDILKEKSETAARHFSHQDSLGEKSKKIDEKLKNLEKTKKEKGILSEREKQISGLLETAKRRIEEAQKDAGKHGKKSLEDYWQERKAI